MHLQPGLYVAFISLKLNFDPLSPQDNIFRLASQFENGRGKSPYDPKMLSASLLLGEFDHCLYQLKEHVHRGDSSLFLTETTHRQMESCTLEHLLISWEGTLPFSVPSEIIIPSEQSSMIRDGLMV